VTTDLRFPEYLPRAALLHYKSCMARSLSLGILVVGPKSSLVLSSTIISHA